MSDAATNGAANGNHKHGGIAEQTNTILSTPSQGQKVLHNGTVFTTVREGLAHILVPQSAVPLLDPKKAKNDGENAQSVFYNPIQQFNRDLSVLAIRAYGEDLMAAKSSRENSRGKKRKRKTTDDVSVPSKKECLSNDAADQKPADATEGPIEVALEQDTEEGGVALTQEQTDSAPSDPTPSGNVNSAIPEPQRRQRPFKILDALSATGLRALRYAHEIPFVSSVTANDLSSDATEAIKANVAHNRLEDKIQAVTGNAMSHMYSFVSSPGDTQGKNSKYDVIDLDPYGTAVPFLDSAVHAVNDGGLLCVTCTDAGIWASCGYPEKTYSQYGGLPIRGIHSHEGGLRLILHSIATAAARYGMAIEPLLSLSIDYYARVFVRVSHSPAEVKMLAGKTMLVYSCDSGCGAWTTQLLARNTPQQSKNAQFLFKHSLAQGPSTGMHCEHCGQKTHLSGPMYGGPLHNAKFVEAILSQLPTLDKKVYGTVERLEGMLTTALEETLIDEASEGEDKAPRKERLIPKVDASRVDRNPFFWNPSALAKVLHARAPSEAQVRGALMHAGYEVTRSHAKPGTIKTNAPWSFVWDMMREWVRQKAPVKEGAIKQGSPGWAIMHGTHKDKAEGPVVKSHEVSPAAVQTIHETATDEMETDALGNGHADATPAVAEPTTKAPKIVFDENLGKQVNKRRLRRYQENPLPNWGPMARAKKVTTV